MKKIKQWLKENGLEIALVGVCTVSMAAIVSVLKESNISPIGKLYITAILSYKNC
jgi:hypothetical protein